MDDSGEVVVPELVVPEEVELAANFDKALFFNKDSKSFNAPVLPDEPPDTDEEPDLFKSKYASPAPPTAINANSTFFILTIYLRTD